jgi:hypothetical protein
MPVAMGSVAPLVLMVMFTGLAMRMPVRVLVDMLVGMTA